MFWFSEDYFLYFEGFEQASALDLGTHNIMRLIQSDKTCRKKLVISTTNVAYVALMPKCFRTQTTKNRANAGTLLFLLMLKKFFFNATWKN